MKPFLGLFAHWDVIVRQEPPKFLNRFFKDKKDSEHCISRKLYQQISPTLVNPTRGMGGNAGNAAVSLSEVGIPCILSCPSREKSFMDYLSKYKIFLMSERRETPPLKCARPDDSPEHIIFEMEGYKKIFNYDPVQLNFLLDTDFWNFMKNANYLFLSGFHTISGKQTKKVNEIADFLEKKKFKVHLELGYGKGLTKYAIKKLLDRNCIDSLGMNETELSVLGISGQSPKEIAESMLSFLDKKGIERMSLHSRDYRLTAFKKNLEKNLKAAEFSTCVCAAKALGGIRENLEKAKSIPPSKIQTLKSKNFFVIPSLLVENPKIIVGMGDTAAVTDSFYALKR